MSEKDSEVIPVKIVLVGESETGKTNIVTQYVDQKFIPDSGATFGANYATKTINIEEYSSSLKLQLWDTAGEEKFRSIARMFYKDASAVILVYDITNEKSFEEIKKYWYKEIKEITPEGTIISIAANKSDLILDAKVSENEGKNYAKSVGAIYKNTSAFSSAGISELFECVCKKILDPTYKEDEERISDVIIKKEIDPVKSFLHLKRNSIRLDNRKTKKYIKRNVVKYVNNSI